MKKRNIFFTLAAMLLLTGCSEDVEQGGGQVNVPVSVVTSGCSEYKSTGDPVAFAAPMRAASNLYTSATGFDGGEKVRVAMNHPATPQTAIFDVAAPVGTDKKSELTLAATEAAPIYYPGAASGTVKLYGMYPTSMTHTVKYDQSSTSMVGDANYKASDLMFGVTDVAWTSMAEKNTLKPNIEFQHQLVKLTLTVVKKEGVKQLQEIRLHNVKRQVEITAFSASGLTLGTPVSPTGESASDGDNKDEIVITGAQAAAADADKTYTFSCIFPAQAWNDGGNAADFLTIKADDYTHTYKLLRNSWTAGTDYQLAINLLPVEADMTASITDWTTDTSYSFDFEGGLKLMPVRVEPTAIDNLHYNGAAQELVNPGSTIGGTLYYYCSTTNSRPAADAAGWSTAIPTGTERGDYYVWTKVVGNIQYFDLDVSETPVTATIGNPFAGLTAAPAPVSNLQYTGAAQPLITAGTAAGGTLKYAVTTTAPSRMLGSQPACNRTAPATEDFSDVIPTATEAGTYYVWYYVEADADHASTEPVMLDPISIGKVTATVATAPTAIADCGTTNEMVTAGTTNDGTIYYTSTTTNSKPEKSALTSTSIPTQTEAGTYYVWYYVKGDDNHDDSDVLGPIEVTVKTLITLTCNTSALAFSQTEEVKSKTGVSCSAGEISVSSSDDTKCTAIYSSGKITVTRVSLSEFSDVTITVSVSPPDDNYIAPDNKTFTVSGAKYLGGVILANSQRGYKVCSNGKAYAPTDELPSNVSVIGMVACKNGSGGGIVLAKSNTTSKGTKVTWENRNNNMPASVRVYVSDPTASVTKSWSCGTAAQMASAVSGTWRTSTPSSGYSSATALNTLMVNAGCDPFMDSNNAFDYWTATESSANNAWYLNTTNMGYWTTGAKTYSFYVRPLFEF